MTGRLGGCGGYRTEGFDRVGETRKNFEAAQQKIHGEERPMAEKLAPANERIHFINLQMLLRDELRRGTFTKTKPVVDVIRQLDDRLMEMRTTVVIPAQKEKP